MQGRPCAYNLIKPVPPPPRIKALVLHSPLGCSQSAIFVVVIARRESQAHGIPPPATTALMLVPVFRLPLTARAIEKVAFAAEHPDLQLATGAGVGRLSC